MIAKPGVQEKVLLHLLDYADFKDKVEVPFALSQMGIANAVAIARSNVPRAISGLRDQGLLVERQAHVQGVSFSMFNEDRSLVVRETKSACRVLGEV